MNLKSRIRVLGLLFIIASNSMVYGQSRVFTSALPFLEINNNARSMGLAGADVALMGGYGVHLNPAIIGNPNNILISSPFTTESGYGLLETPWLKSVNDGISFSSPFMIIGFDQLSIGVHIHQMNIEPIDYSEFLPEMENAEVFKSKYKIVGISGSYRLNEYLFVGAGVNYYKEQIYSVQVSGLSLDFGGYIHYPIRVQDFFTITPSAGISITDFGPHTVPDNIRNNEYFVDVDDSEDISAIIESSKYPLPTRFRGGLGLQFELDKKVFDLKPLSIGWYGALNKGMNWNKDGSLASPIEALFNPGAYPIRHSGFEYIFMEMVSIRVGSYKAHESEGGRAYNTIGFGLHYKYFQLDYAEIRETSSESWALNGTKYVQLTGIIPLGLLTGLSGN